MIVADAEIAEDLGYNRRAVEDGGGQPIGNRRQYGIIGRERQPQLVFAEQNIVTIERHVETFGKDGFHRGWPAPGDENAGFGHGRFRSMLQNDAKS